MATNYDDILYPNKSPRSPQPQREGPPETGMDKVLSVTRPVMAGVESGIRNFSMGLIDPAAAQLESVVTRKPLEVILERMRAQRATQEKEFPKATMAGGVVGDVAGTMLFPERLAVQMPVQATQAAMKTYTKEQDTTLVDAGEAAVEQAVMTGIFGLGAKVVGGALEKGKSWLFGREAGKLKELEEAQVNAAKDAMTEARAYGTKAERDAATQKYRNLKEGAKYPYTGEALEEMALQSKNLSSLGTFAKKEAGETFQDVTNIWKRPFSDLSQQGAITGAALSGGLALYHGKDPLEAGMYSLLGGVAGAKTRTAARAAEAVGRVGATALARNPQFIPKMKAAVTRGASGMSTLTEPSFEDESNPYMDFINQSPRTK